MKASNHIPLLVHEFTPNQENTGLFVLTEILQPLNSKRKILISSDCSCTSATRNGSHHFLGLLQLRIQDFFEIEVLMFNRTRLQRT